MNDLHLLMLLLGQFDTMDRRILFGGVWGNALGRWSRQSASWKRHCFTDVTLGGRETTLL